VVSGISLGYISGAFLYSPVEQTGMASEPQTVEVEGEEYEYTAEKPWRDAGLLQTLYWENDMTFRDIGDAFGCSKDTVYNWVERLGVRGGGSDCMRAAVFSQNTQGYEQWRHKISGTNYNVKIHRLLAVAEYGFDAVCENDVHHQNHIPWDNRPENIEVKSHEQHARDHADELHGHEKAPWRDEDKLREMYVDNKMSCPKIADNWGCDVRTVINWCNKHGIETRSQSEAQQLRYVDTDQQTLTEAE
jgi:transposase